jgi:hypothetical protein
MHGPSAEDLDLARKRFVGQPIDTVRNDIEAVLGRYALEIAPDGTIFTMQYDPNRVRVVYTDKGLVRSIDNG